MSDQMTLELHNGTTTSREAAMRIVGEANNQRARILLELYRHDGGLCAFEIEQLLGMSGNTVRPRLVELARHGHVRATDETRLTPSGRPAAIWKAVRR